MIDLATLTAEPLLLAPTHAHSLAAALKREPEEYDHSKDVAAIYGVMPSQPEKPFAFANGVAFISVRGTLINRSTASYSWLTGYKGIVARVQAAAADPQVTAVVYDVDSYGGEAAGCFEAAAFCRATLMAAGKPSMAMIDSNAYSAGFAMAVAADEVVCIPSGGAGSIGVVTMHADMSKALDEYGVKVTYIYAGKHKVDGNPYGPLPADVRADIQKRIDDRYSAFTAHVDSMRGLAAGTAAKTEAQIFSAADALALGLIDRISSAPEALAEFCDRVLTEASSSIFMEAIMADPQAPDVAAVQSEARRDERARCKAILTHAEADGRADMASYLAFDTDMSAEQSGAMLGKAPKAAAPAPAAAAPVASPLAAAMAQIGTPGIAPDGAESGVKSDAAAQEVNTLLASLALATGRKVA